MDKKIRYSAKNMRPDCNERDCFTCNYFDHSKGYCSADKEIKDCSYCKNAFTVGSRQGFKLYVNRALRQRLWSI